METVLLRAPFVGIAVTAPVSRSTHPSDPMDREFIDPLKAILIYHPVLLVHAAGWTSPFSHPHGWRATLPGFRTHSGFVEP